MESIFQNGTLADVGIIMLLTSIFLWIKYPRAAWSFAMFENCETMVDFIAGVAMWVWGCGSFLTIAAIFHFALK
jgi:hypothetical protein